MRISIFTGSEASQTRAVSEEREFDAADICYNMWSPALFKDGLRTNGTFASIQAIVLDIDDGLTLAEGVKLFSQYNHIVATTRSHQKDKNGVTCDRFRVILPIHSPIHDMAVFKATWNAAAKLCPQLDRACSDVARFYFPCTNIISHVSGKSYFPITQPDVDTKPSTVNAVTVPGATKGQISKKAMDFLLNGAPRGQWHPRRNDFVRECRQNSYSFEEMRSLFSVYHKADSTDEFQFKDIWERGVRHAPRLMQSNGDALVEFVMRSKMLINVEDIDDYRFVDLQTGAERRLDKRAVLALLGREGFKTFSESNSTLAQFSYKPPYISPIYVDDDGMTVYNQYQPPVWLKDEFYFGHALTPIDTIPPLYATFIRHLTDNDEPSYEYLIDWLATSLQGRNLTLLTAIGEQGIGKGTLGDIMEKLHGKTNFVKVRDQVFKDKFNAALKNKTLVYVDEIDLQTKESQDRIKDVVNSSVEIEQKGIDPHTADNYASFYLSSNSLDAIKIEGGDRRFSIIQLTEKKIIDTDLSGAAIDELKKESNIADLARYLRFKKVSRNMYVPFRSARYEEVREASLQDWELFVLEDWAPKHRGQTVLLSELRIALEVSNITRNVPGRPKMMKLVRKYPEILKMRRKASNLWYVEVRK